MKSLYKNGKLSLALLLLITFLLIYLTDRYILTPGFYENNGDPLSAIPGRDIGIYEALQKWVYISSAVYLLLKLGVVALVLHTALYLRDQNVGFSKVLKIAVLADFIFLIPAAIKILTFKYTFDHGSLLDWHRYYILSALSISEYAPADWYYALQSLNIFEIAYWFVLAYGISKITGLDFDNALKTVMTSYVPSLLIWVVAITFFTLLMFPATG